MKKLNRIRKNEEFSSIIKKKHSYNAGTFIIYYENKKESEARIGLSVSKKLGNAVVRNKIKRQIRMMVHETIDYKTCNFDIILIARPSYLDKSYLNNKNNLAKALKTCKII